MDNIIENWTQSLMTKVIYTCSRSWLLADKLRDLSQAEKKITLGNSQNDNYFHTKWSKDVILNENNCNF